MGNKLDPKEVVTFDELLISNTIQQEALINILGEKGLVSKREILEEIRRIKKESKNGG